MARRVIWELAGAILQTAGVLMIQGVMIGLIFFLVHIFYEPPEIGIGQTFLLMIMIVILMGLPGYLLYKYGQRVSKKAENIVESNRRAVQEVKQAKAVKNSALVSAELFAGPINAALPQVTNESLSSSHTFTQTISTNDMSPLNSERLQNGEPQQQETAAVSPKPRVVSCKGCGANNIIESDKARCEYCRGYLT